MTGGVQGQHYTDVNHLATETRRQARRAGHADPCAAARRHGRGARTPAQCRDPCGARRSRCGAEGVGGSRRHRFGARPQRYLLQGSPAPRGGARQSDRARRRGEFLGLPHRWRRRAFRLRTSIHDSSRSLPEEAARIPVTIGVASGPEKVGPIAAVLNGGYIDIAGRRRDDGRGSCWKARSNLPDTSGATDPDDWRFRPRKPRALGLGTWAIGGWMWGGTDEAAIDRRHPGLDRRGRHADRHRAGLWLGRAEEIVGQGDRGPPRQGRAVDQVRARLAHAEGQPLLRRRAAVGAPLSRRRLDRLRGRAEPASASAPTTSTIYITHWQDPTTPIAETMGALEDLKAQGKIRAIGASNVSRPTSCEYLAHGRLDAIQERTRMDRDIEARAGAALPRAWRRDHVLLLAGARPPVGQDRARSRLRRRRPARHEPALLRRRTVPSRRRCCAASIRSAQSSGSRPRRSSSPGRSPARHHLCPVRCTHPEQAMENARAGSAAPSLPMSSPPSRPLDAHLTDLA